MLEYTTIEEKENIEVPKAVQKLVIERFEEVRENPERLLDWEEAKQILKV